MMLLLRVFEEVFLGAIRGGCCLALLLRFCVAGDYLKGALFCSVEVIGALYGATYLLGDGFYC